MGINRGRESEGRLQWKKEAWGNGCKYLVVRYPGPAVRIQCGIWIGARYYQQASFNLIINEGGKVLL